MGDAFDETVKDGGLSDYPIQYRGKCRRCNREITGTHARTMCGRCTQKGVAHMAKINRAAGRRLTARELQDEMKLQMTLMNHLELPLKDYPNHHEHRHNVFQSIP